MLQRNGCPICGKCSISASNQYCREHEILNSNTYERLLEDILSMPRWKLEAAVKYKLFSSKTERRIIRYLEKE